MWRRLFWAEIYKIITNRWPTIFLVWIFPAMVVAGTVIGVFAVMVSAELRTSLQDDPLMWTEGVISMWNIPNDLFGRLLLLGFTAVQFGGEYQWNTWKVIVPRTWRVPLLLTKYLALGVFIVVTFAVTSVMYGLGFWLISSLAGATYGPAVSLEVLRDFVGNYVLQMFSAFMGTAVVASYAALAAMVTRSILGSVMASLFINIVEASAYLPLVLMAEVLQRDDIIHMFRFLPFYNLNNIDAWLFDDQALGLEVGPRLVEDSLLFSLVLVAGWMVVLVGMTTWLFQRQDITN